MLGNLNVGRCLPSVKKENSQLTSLVFKKEMGFIEIVFFFEDRLMFIPNLLLFINAYCMTITIL
jgi:hypothetical protein